MKIIKVLAILIGTFVILKNMLPDIEIKLIAELVMLITTLFIAMDYYYPTVDYQ